MKNSELLVKLRELDLDPGIWAFCRPLACLAGRTMEDRAETVGELIGFVGAQSPDSTLAIRIEITREFEILEVLFLDEDIISFEDGNPIMALVGVETEVLGPKNEVGLFLVFE